nr:hypothetical protein CFP56_50660 [Quercus suber]
MTYSNSVAGWHILVPIGLLFEFLHFDLPPIKSYSVIVASLRTLCSSVFNTSMLAKPSVLVNLVVLTKRPTYKSSLLSGLAVLTKRICCLGDLVHSKVLKELADTAWL